MNNNRLICFWRKVEKVRESWIAVPSGPLKPLKEGFFFMEHFVYIIYSEKFDVFYKGESHDPLQRLISHNSDLSEYTRNKGPWRIVFLEKHEDRKSALGREKQIKKFNRRSIEKLIASEANICTS